MVDTSTADSTESHTGLWLVGKSGLRPISHWIFFVLRRLAIFQTPLPFREVLFQLQENSLFSASVLQKHVLNERHSPSAHVAGVVSTLVSAGHLGQRGETVCILMGTAWHSLLTCFLPSGFSQLSKHGGLPAH